MSRAQELLRSTPQCVLAIISLCIITYIWQITFQPIEHHYTLCPRAILYRYQYYRILTSPFLHGSITHIGMNMMSYLSLGTYLEKSFGSMWHYTTIMSSVCLVNLTFVILSFVLYQSDLYKDSFGGHSLGFSGVLFHLLVIQCHMNSSSTHSVFGLLNVSSKSYPWVLLIGIQLILPHVSFMGHFSGIIVGEVHTRGYWNCILPSSARLRYMEEWNVVRRMASGRENYIQTPSSDQLFDITFGGRRDLSSSLWMTNPDNNGRSIVMTYCTIIGTFFHGIYESIKVKIFGRGREVNENIRLSDTEMNSLLLGVGDIDEIGEEDNWVGLGNNQQQEDVEYKSDLV